MQFGANQVDLQRFDTGEFVQHVYELHTWLADTGMTTQVWQEVDLCKFLQTTPGEEALLATTHCDTCCICRVHTSGNNLWRTPIVPSKAANTARQESSDV